MAKAKSKKTVAKKKTAVKKPADNFLHKLKEIEEKTYHAALEKILNFVHKFESKKEKIVAKAVSQYETKAAKEFEALFANTNGKKSKRKKPLKKHPQKLQKKLLRQNLQQKQPKLLPTTRWLKRNQNSLPHTYSYSMRRIRLRIMLYAFRH
jgi:hypothetical protein